MPEKDDSDSVVISIAEAHYNLGNAKYVLGDYKGAIEEWQKAIELNSDLTNSLNLKIRKAQKRIKGKSTDHTTVELSADLPGAYCERGNARYHLRDYNGAVEDYSKAIRLDPEYLLAYSNRGAAKYKLGDYNGAIEDWQKAMQIDPSTKERLQPNIARARAKMK